MSSTGLYQEFCWLKRPEGLPSTGMMNFRSSSPTVLSPEDVFAISVINGSALKVSLHPVSNDIAESSQYQKALGGLPIDRNLVFDLGCAGMLPDTVLGTILAINRQVVAEGYQVIFANTDPNYASSLHTKRIHKIIPLCSTEEALIKVGEIDSGIPGSLSDLKVIFNRADHLLRPPSQPCRPLLPSPPEPDSYVKVLKSDGAWVVWTNAQQLHDDDDSTKQFVQALTDHLGEYPVVIDLSGVTFLGECAVLGIVQAIKRCAALQHELTIRGCEGQPEATLRTKKLLH
jgi:hypothetical protein